jgi:hypothetical protein
MQVGDDLLDRVDSASEIEILEARRHRDVPLQVLAPDFVLPGQFDHAHQGPERGRLSIGVYEERIADRVH